MGHLRFQYPALQVPPPLDWTTLECLCCDDNSNDGNILAQKSHHNFRTNNAAADKRTITEMSKFNTKKD